MLCFSFIQLNRNIFFYFTDYNVHCFYFIFNCSKSYHLNVCYAVTSFIKGKYFVIIISCQLSMSVNQGSHKTFQNRSPRTWPEGNSSKKLQSHIVILIKFQEK